MESDFGAPLADDYEQDYSSYGRAHCDLSLEDDWDSDDNHDFASVAEDTYIDDAASAKRRKGGRRRSRGAATAAKSHRNTSFYDYVLCWPVDKVGRSALLELPGPAVASLRTEYIFAGEEQYVAYMMATVLEEVRALLSQAVPANNARKSFLNKSPSDGAPFSATLASYDDGKQAYNSCLVMLQVCAAGGLRVQEQQYSRPGSVFLMTLQQPEENKDPFSFFAAVSIGGKYLSDDGSLLCLWVHRSVFQKIIAGDIGESFRRLSKKKIRVSDSSIAVCGVDFYLEPIANVLSHQRMAAGLQDYPAGRGCDFLRAVLGTGRATAGAPRQHIRFHDCNGSDDEARGSSAGLSSQAPVGSDDPTSTTLPQVQHQEIVASLNAAQKAALLEMCAGLCLSSSCAARIRLVQGPPGTGKTQLTCSFLHVLQTGGYRALVAAPSNRAVCVLLERLLLTKGHEYSGSARSKGLAAVDKRWSRVSPNDVSDGHREQLETIASRRTIRLIGVGDKLDIAELIEPSSGGAPAARPKESGLESINAAIDAFALPASNSDVFCCNYRERLRRVLQLLAGVRSGASALPEQLLPFIFKQLSKIEIRISIDLVGCSRGRGHDEFRDTIWRALDLAGAASRASSSPSATLSRVLELCGWLADSVLGTYSYDDVVSSLLQSCDILFCTLCSSALSAVKKSLCWDSSGSVHNPLDYVVVDEAANCLEAEAIVPLFLFPRNIVFVGDPQQLPATVNSRDISGSGKDMSIMQRLMTPAPQGPGHAYSLLTTQYRMHPKIASFPNQQFYEGRLATADEVIARPAFFTHPPCGAGAARILSEVTAFIDVGDKSNAQLESNVPASISNVSEAAAAAALLAAIDGTRTVDVCSCARVITFYSAQVRVIKEQLRLRGLGGVSVSTVDSFQGSEADIIVLSFVRCNERSSIGFLSDFRRLNVAITRARQRLYCVGSLRTLLLSSSPGGGEKSPVNALAEHYSGGGLVFSAATLR